MPHDPRFKSNLKEYFYVSDDCAKLIARGGWAEDLTRNKCTIPIGPRNAISNIAYLAAGIGTFLLDRTFAGFVMAIAFFALAIGSTWYHTFKTYAGNQADWAGMYACFGVLVVHAQLPTHPWAPLIAAGLGAVVAIVYAYELNGVGVDQQMGLMFILSIIRPVFVGQTIPALLSFGMFLLAYLAWQLDKHRSEITGLWGHAVWHILTAAAMMMLYFAQY